MENTKAHFVAVEDQAISMADQMALQTDVINKHRNDAFREQKLHTVVQNRQFKVWSFWSVTIFLLFFLTTVNGSKTFKLPCDLDTTGVYDSAGRTSKVKYSNPYQEVCQDAYLLHVKDSQAGTITNCNTDNNDEAASVCLEPKTPGIYQYYSHFTDSDTDKVCWFNYHVCKYRKIKEFEINKGQFCIQEFRGLDLDNDDWFKQLFGAFSYIVQNPLLEYKTGYFYMNQTEIFGVNPQLQLGSNSAVLQTSVTSYYNDFKECYQRLQNKQHCQFSNQTIIFLLQMTETPEAPQRDGTKESPALNPLIPTIVQHSCLIDLTFSSNSVAIVLDQCDEGDYIGFRDLAVQVRNSAGCLLGEQVIDSNWQTVNYLKLGLKFKENCKFSLTEGQDKPSNQCVVTYFKDIQGKESHVMGYTHVTELIKGFRSVLIWTIVAILSTIITVISCIVKTQCWKKRSHKKNKIKEIMKQINDDNLMKDYRNSNRISEVQAKVQDENLIKRKSTVNAEDDSYDN